MTGMLEPILRLCAPLNCSLLALAVVLLLPVLRRRIPGTATRLALGAAGLAAYFAVWHLLALTPAGTRWLTPLGSPLVGVYLVIILPALFLPRSGIGRKLYLAVPALGVLLAVAAVFDGYGTVPDSARGFYWFLIRPAYLLVGVASALVLLQPFLSLSMFRAATRLACFVVLVYGGFMFRQSYLDYQDMLSSRGGGGIMMVSETSPVMSHDWRMLHLPSAPCRFTADGGYIQGCNLELAQRLLQADFSAVAARDSGAIAVMSVVLGSIVLFLIITFVAARWMCGWLCPLSAIGGGVDWIRRRLGLPHLKPSQPVKLAYLFSGIGVAGLTLAMARAYPSLDADGKFLGCKIPIYPFCKVCPSQQICPVVARGPSEYAGLPDWEWGNGFFLTVCLGLLTLFFLSFALGRQLWCRFCPMGMISGLFNRGGGFKLLKDPGKCNRCGVCADVCPMDIDHVRSEMRDPDVGCFDCVLCLRCVDKCPKDGCLSVEHAGNKVFESKFQA